MIRLKAPAGKKLRHIKSGLEYSEVICEEKKRDMYELTDGATDIEVEMLDGVTLGDRVSDLEDAVIELAEIISEGV